MVKKINGFELEAISEIVSSIKKEPSIAKFEFRINNEWIKAGHNRSYIKSFYGGGREDDSRSRQFIFDSGDPPILLGNNEGANPVEFVLHALAGCMTTTMALHAAANSISVKKISSKIEGDMDVQGFFDLDPKVRNGYQNVRVSFEVTGDLTDEEKEKLSDFCYKSPVFDIVSNQVPIVVQVS